MKLEREEWPEWLTKWLEEQDIEPLEIHTEEKEGAKVITVLLEHYFFKLYYYYDTEKIQREMDEKA